MLKYVPIFIFIYLIFRPVHHVPRSSWFAPLPLPSPAMARLAMCTEWHLPLYCPSRLGVYSVSTPQINPFCITFLNLVLVIMQSVWLNNTFENSKPCPNPARKLPIMDEILLQSVIAPILMLTATWRLAVALSWVVNARCSQPFLLSSYGIYHGGRSCLSAPSWERVCTLRAGGGVIELPPSD